MRGLLARENKLRKKGGRDDWVEGLQTEEEVEARELLFLFPVLPRLAIPFLRSQEDGSWGRLFLLLPWNYTWRLFSPFLVSSMQTTSHCTVLPS